MGARVHAANEQDSRAAPPLEQETAQVWPSLRFARVDSAYVSAMTQEVEAAGVTITVPAKHGRSFKAQPVRWRIEQTIAWLNNFRRLCSDFDRTVEVTERSSCLRASASY